MFILEKYNKTKRRAPRPGYYSLARGQNLGSFMPTVFSQNFNTQVVPTQLPGEDPVGPTPFPLTPPLYMVTQLGDNLNTENDNKLTTE